MTTFPLPTLACTVTSTGISGPAYVDILTSLQTSFQSIYGADAYLDNDSMDGQWLAILAQAVYDGNQADIATYNAYSPATAQGAGLSSVVKINGLARLVPSNSSVPVQIVGQIGVTITNGAITDSFGNQWSLPASVTIPNAGTITVTATCQTSGAITAAAQVFAIATPVAGWQTATSVVSATPGAPVESDPTLRGRQSVSTALPATSVRGGIYASLANLTGVQRLQVYENDTGAADANGLPAHSIAAVVQGGDALAIAQAIALKKTPGCYTYGTTSESVPDAGGIPETIQFFILSLVTTSVRIVATALTGYVSTTGTALEASVAAFLSGLDIGEDSYYTRLYGPATLSGDAATGATGQSQLALDALAKTYNVTALFQARSDMVTISGPYSGGATTMSVTNPAAYATGKTINFLLNSGNYLTAVVTGVAGTAVSFLPAIPSGATVTNGTLVYVAGDVVMAFNEAATALPANVLLSIS